MTVSSATAVRLAFITTGVAICATIGSACADPILGARCSPGYDARDGRCVLAARDAALDAAGADGSTGATDAGTDGGEASDGGGLDGGALVDASPDDGSAAVDGGGVDGGTDAGAVSCDLGTLDCGGTCVDPRTDAHHCGACSMACATGELCAGGRCATTCPAPFTSCAGACVDTSSDPNHCGRCAVRCASGICVDGTCADPTAGHLVIVGHDYRSGRTGMNRLAGNAVFLGAGSPVRVLAYEGASLVSSIRGVDRAIDQVARERGRLWLKSTTPAEELTYGLAGADVLVIYPQQGATDAVLRDFGARWQVALASFFARGGVVVLFEGAGGNEGTYQIADAARFFDAVRRVEVTDGMVTIAAPGDAVALAVPLGYRVETSTFWFETSDDVVVARHVEGPVVIHSVVVP